MTTDFEDAQELAKLHPETFDAPTPESLNAIEPGDLVKVCAHEERFWCEVESISGDIITAAVRNNLLTDKLAYGDVVTFGRRHIYDID